MASITASSISAPAFAVQRTSESPKVARACFCFMPPSASHAAAAAPLIKASFKEKASKAFVAVTAGVLLASSAASASAIDILMGASDGALVFLPNEFSVSAGEQINFINNAGFPHNVIFDEEGVPAGVDPAAISMPDGKLLNSKDEKHSVVLTKPGAYSFYCEPHQGNGMEGKVIVK